MKTTQLFIASISLAILSSSCNSGTDSQAVESSQNQEESQMEGKEASTEMEIKLSQEEAHITVDYYLKIKDALVASNGDSAQDIAASAKAALEGHNDEFSEGLKGELDEIMATNNLEVQRTSLVDLTEKVYQLALMSDLEKELYLQHCPMALEGEGANWISATKEIRNPYFGDRMLKCGRTEEKI